LHWKNLCSGFQRFVCVYFRTLYVINIPNQVNGGEQHLNTTRDYFQFVTKFFEIIKLSAPHIYHSALELSPQSSIVREKYYFKFFQDHKPRVIYGVFSSWKPAGIDGNYGSYTWSPCGQFFATQTSTSVEIRDTLTLDKCSTLQPTKPIPEDLKPIGHSPSALAYSPDGHSLVGCFGSAATIWDIQTGGVIKEIECGAIDASPKSLVWSLDGTTIGALFPAGVGSWTVVTCDIASVKVSTCAVQSPFEPYLWLHESSIWMMAVSGNKTTINTSEIWPTTFGYPVKSYSTSYNISDDPVMHQDGFISGNFHGGMLCAYNIHTQRFMLSEPGLFTSNCFSPRGGLFAASNRHEVCIWRLEEYGRYYHQQRKFPLWEALGDTPRGLKFSPTPSSLLISRDGFLEVQLLEGSITHTPEKTILIEFSTNGTYLVTAFKDEKTVTTTNLYNSHSQFIVINFPIHQLILASNILFVYGPGGYVVAWRLTVEGTVDGASDIRRVGYHSRYWTRVRTVDHRLQVDYQIDVINGSDNIAYYNVETREELEPVVSSIPLPSLPSQKDFYHGSKSIDFSTWPSFSGYDLVEYNNHHSEDNLPASTPWCQKGWLMYPEGEYKHRLWLPTHWRTKWEEAHWLNNIKMVRLVIASGKVIIKL